MGLDLGNMRFETRRPGFTRSRALRAFDPKLWWRRRGVAPLVQKGMTDGFYECILPLSFAKHGRSTGGPLRALSRMDFSTRPPGGGQEDSPLW